jgi:DNA-binding transcriptional LysR family regulator
MSLVRAGLGVAIVAACAIAGFNTDGLKTLPIIGPTLSRNLELNHAQGTRANPLP